MAQDFSTKSAGFIAVGLRQWPWWERATQAAHLTGARKKREPGSSWAKLYLYKVHFP